MTEQDETCCGPSMIAFGGTLLIAASLVPALSPEVAWAWFSAGTAGLGSAVGMSERYKTPRKAGEPVETAAGPFVVSVLRDGSWFQTSAVFSTMEQAEQAAQTLRDRLRCETKILAANAEQAAKSKPVSSPAATQTAGALDSPRKPSDAGIRSLRPGLS